ncbi:V-type ATPase subunit [Acutalibacter intestini]|uniref:V-type ATPase subunit n=1 Tax=Acutalibacter intestini TaxID=3093659 RepID=UPI002AC96903|nr:V-type ATPase subunit [Acutalibacter sp. M00204]
MSDNYIYAVARVRSRELGLLGRQDVDQLMACRSYDECLRVLSDKGWGAGEGASSEAVLAAEEEKTWAFIHELTDDLTPFQVLLFPTDYNNLKAAIKAVVTSVQPQDVFLPGGAVDPQLMLRCVREGDFTELPGRMAQAADDAYHTLLQTEDGQLCDVILDQACLADVLDCGRNSESDILEAYAEMLAATSNIKVAVRACKTGKSRAFLDMALAPCGSLDVAGLAVAACKGLDELFAYLAVTPYGEAAERLKDSYSAFEKWCDDKVMDLVKEQKMNPFGIGPLFAYVIARRNEISTVRIILSGKLNELDDGMIRERLREMYV